MNVSKAAYKVDSFTAIRRNEPKTKERQMRRGKKTKMNLKNPEV